MLYGTYNAESTLRSVRFSMVYLYRYLNNAIMQIFVCLILKQVQRADDSVIKFEVT